MDKLNQWLSLTANLGVVAGIVFLAYEVSINTDSLRANTAATVVQGYIDVTTEVGTSPEYIAAYDNWHADPSTVSTTGMRHLLWIGVGNFKSSEFGYLQWLDGNLDDRLWNGLENGLFYSLSLDRYLVPLWEEVRGGHSAEFRQLVDAMVARLPDEAPVSVIHRIDVDE